MRRTHLYIKVNNKWNDVELFEDIVIPITLKVQDIRSFGSKSASYSSDITIPHTQANAQIFGLIEELNAYNATFEFCKNYDAYIAVDGLTVFIGQFRMKKVFKQRGGQYSYYVGCLFSDTKTFFDKLGTQTLTGNDNPSYDIDFSEYDTPASEMTINDFRDRLTSHDTSGEDWGLTFIDKTNKAAQPFSQGYQQWYADECTPYLNVMGILNRIISGTGYECFSEFLSGDGSTYLQDTRWADTIGKYNVYDLIYPYTKHNSNLILANNISSVVSQNSSNSNTIAVVRTTTLPINIPTQAWTASGYSLNFDSSKYTLTESNVTSSLSSYTFTAPQAGRYTVNIKFPFKIRANMYKKNTSTPVENGLQILNWATTQGYYPDEPEKFNGSNSLVFQIEAKKNMTISIGAGVDVLEDLQEHYTVEDNNGLITLYSGTFTYNNQIDLQAGDTITVNTNISIPLFFKWLDEDTWNQWFTYDTFMYPTTDPISHVTSYSGCQPYKLFLEITGSYRTNIVSITAADTFYENSPFTPNCILNPKTTKIEFLQNIMKMFNLYIEDVSGKLNYATGYYYRPNTLRIEPYQIYYNPNVKFGSNVKDWTDRIDWDDVEYRRIDEYLYNIQRFSYADNKDFYVSNYNDTYKTPYMQRDVKGEFCTTNDDVNNISISNGSVMCGLVNSDTDTFQCPKLFSLDKSGNIDTKKEYSDTIMFLWHNDMSANTDTHDNYFVIVRPRAGVGGTILTDYYCADTLNKGYGLDDANLSFGNVEEWYQNLKGTIPTYNDLYSAFYKKQYDDMSSTDSRIMVAKAYLTAFDIATLQLCDTIILGDNKWHILEIKEWKNEKEPCEIQLIKVIGYEGVSSQQSKIVFNRPLSSMPVANTVLETFAPLDESVVLPTK